MTERYTDANAPIKDKRSLLTKMLPNALRVGAIGSILLTAACSSTERQFVEAPRDWECSEVNQGNFEPCRQVSIGHGGEVHPVGWKRDTTSPDYKESDYVSGFREVKTDWLHTEKWTQADWKRYYQAKDAATLLIIGTTVVTPIVLLAKYINRSGRPSDIAGERVPRGRRAFGEKPPKFQPQHPKAEELIEEIYDPDPRPTLERLNKWAVEVYWIKVKAWEARHGITSSYPQDGDGSEGDENEILSAAESPKTEPKHLLSSGTHIQPHPLEGTWFEGPKTLRDNSGVTGHLRRDAIFDRQQIISDKSGLDVGRIEPDALFEDRQVIRDGRGNRVGSIETNWRGERVIKDKDGKETGKFKKEWWGDTEIK